MTCGPGTSYNSIANQCDCEIACGPSNGRRMATEVPLEIADSADDAQLLAVVWSLLEKHPEVAKVDKLRLRLKQLLGQPALA
jgi:hypothetical protein